MSINNVDEFLASLNKRNYFSELSHVQLDAESDSKYRACYLRQDFSGESLAIAFGFLLALFVAGAGVFSTIALCIYWAVF